MSDTKRTDACRIQVPPRDGHHSDRVAPVEEPFDSYSTNRLCLHIGGKQVWLEPGERRAKDAEPIALPTELQGHPSLTYISAWNPDGERCSVRENEIFHAQLRTYIEALGLASIDAVAVAREGQWFEQGLMVIDLSAELAHDLAWKYDQEGWIRVDEQGWHTQPRYEGWAPQTLTYNTTRRTKRRCPVRMFDAKTDVCGAYGGPWTSASRSALSFWTAHRSLGMTLLGCGTCNNGKKPIRAFGHSLVLSPTAGVITLREVCVASRFGGYCYGRRKDEYSWMDPALSLKDARQALDELQGTTTQDNDDETGETE